MTVKKLVKLHKPIIRTTPYLEFAEDNDIIFFQDHSWWKGVPDKVKFYIDKLSSRGVWLVADGYGALKDNKFNLPHNYGNGSIAVDFKYLTPDIEDFCKKHYTDSPDKSIL